MNGHRLKADLSIITSIRLYLGWQRGSCRADAHASDNLGSLVNLGMPVSDISFQPSFLSWQEFLSCGFMSAIHQHERDNLQMS